MLYRVGTQVLLESGAYDYRIVSESEYESAIADGWHLDQYAAKDAAEKPVESPDLRSPNPFDTIHDDDAPPTREELETKARELGIKFDGRTGDKKLAALIKEKL